MSEISIDGLTKKEISILQKWHYKFCDDDTFDREIDHVVMVVHNPSRKHDSGYPFIRAFGSKKDTLYDMGWHDHYLTDVGVNTDALGKNIWRVMPWCEDGKWRTIANGIWCSTLWLRKGVWS